MTGLDIHNRTTLERQDKIGHSGYDITYLIGYTRQDMTYLIGYTRQEIQDRI